MGQLFFELSANLFDAVLGVFFVMRLCGGRLRSHALPTVAATAGCFAVSTAYLFISHFSLLQSVIIYSILLAYAFSLPGDLAKKVLGPTMFELSLILVSSALVMGYSRIFGMSLEELFSAASIERYLFVISAKVTETLLLALILRFFTARGTFRPLDLAMYLTYPLMTVFVLYTYMRLGLGEDINRIAPLVIVAVLGLAVSGAFSLMIFGESTKNLAARHELELYQHAREMDELRYRELQTMYERLSMTRHDFRWQLTLIKKLIEEGRSQEVEDFIRKTESVLEESESIVHTGNRMIDYIIDTKVAANPDTTFYISGHLCPMAAPDEFGQASLFGNLLQNAAEAVRSCENRRIDLLFYIQNGYQNIICKNPVPKSVLSANPMLATAKERKDLHGFGVASMRKTVEEAGGIIDFYEEEGLFCVHIALPLADTDDS